MEKSIKLNFPLRGAIGGGDFYKDGDIMISSGLIDAAQYERKQDWLGAVITPKALNIIENVRNSEIKTTGDSNIDMCFPRFSSFVKFGKIHWKENAKYNENPEGYYIKPFKMSDIEWREFLPSYFTDQNKIDNSEIYMQKNELLEFSQFPALTSNRITSPDNSVRQSIRISSFLIQFLSPDTG